MSIVRPSALLEKLMKVKRIGKPRKGVSTGFETVDTQMLLNKQYLMLVTGYPSHGKSVFVDSLAVNSAYLHDWKWLFFSPETDALESHLQKLIAKKTGKRLVSTPDVEIQEAVEWAENHFSWIDASERLYLLDDLLDEVEARIQSGEQIDALVIDPWNELDHSKQLARDDIYIGQCLTKLRKFHRKYNLLTVIVIHPHSVQKDKEGNFPIPALRDCAGGAMWWNKSDYGICVYRKDILREGAEIIIQKVKEECIGTPGKVFLDYERAVVDSKTKQVISLDCP
jgi:twinkle protein